MEATASSSLDAIRDGGAKLAVLAMGRAREVIASLETGDFTEAMIASQQLHEKCQHLHMAKITMGALSAGSIVRVSELEVGMRILDATGEAEAITDLRPCPCDRPGCQKRQLTIGDEDMVWQGSQEVVILAD